MKYHIITLTFYLLSGLLVTAEAQEATAIQTSVRTSLEEGSEGSSMDCQHVVRVESPAADTYTSIRSDTLNFGTEISMKLRGSPEKKVMLSHLNFIISDIDQQEVTSCILKVYTVSKHVDSKLLLYGMGESIDEESTVWKDQPTIEVLLDSKPIGSHPFVEFDVTTFVKDRLALGRVNFCIRTDSKNRSPYQVEKADWDRN